MSEGRTGWTREEGQDEIDRMDQGKGQGQIDRVDQGNSQGKID